MNLESIEKELTNGLIPHRAADIRVELSGYYSRMSGELQEILALKPSRWLMIRKDVKTDKEADRVWDAGEMGIQEMRLKMNMKRIDKIISSLSSFIRVAEQESKFNTY